MKYARTPERVEGGGILSALKEYESTLLLELVNEDLINGCFHDNGASLGFRFDEDKLKEYFSNDAGMHKYTRYTKLKVVIFEKTGKNKGFYPDIK